MASIDLATRHDIQTLMEKVDLMLVAATEKQEKAEPFLYTNESLSEMLDISTRTLQKYRDTRKINFSQEGRNIWYTRQDVENFLLNNSNAPFQQEQRRNQFAKQSKRF